MDTKYSSRGIKPMMIHANAGIIEDYQALCVEHKQDINKIFEDFMYSMLKMAKKCK